MGLQSLQLENAGLKNMLKPLSKIIICIFHIYIQFTLYILVCFFIICEK